MRGIAFVGSACLLGSVALAAAPPEEPPALRLRESFRRTLRAPGGRPTRGLELREARALRVDLRLPAADPGGLAADTPVGLRVGEALFGGVLGDDPRWSPGRPRARLPLEGGGEIRLRWRAGELRVAARLPGASPYAEGRTGDPEGPLAGDLDAAFRVGEEGFRLAGPLVGDVRHRPVPVLGETVDCARVRLEGEGRVLSPTEDALQPLVAIAAPSDGRLVPPGTVTVEGTLRDDRVVDRLTVSVDGGPEVEVPFDRDPATGYLDDLLGTFSLDVEAPAGTHAVEVRAYDGAGNVGLASVAFFAGAAPTRVLDAGDGEGAAAPGWAGIDLAGEVRRGSNPSLAVEGLRGSVAVAAQPLGLLALRADGTVLALGVNGRGFLGNGGTANAAVPVEVAGLSGVTAVAAGGETGIALRADGSVWTWGDGRYGNLGDGAFNAAPRTTAAPVEGIPAMRFVTAHAYGAAAVDEEGFVWTWGYLPGPLAPTKVAGPVDIVSVASSSSGDFLLAVDGNGEVWSWGANGYGQCGRAGSTVVPAKVPGISGAVAAACGRDHSLVLLGDGTVVAFGRDLYGTLGDGAAVAPAGTHVVVPGLDGVVAVEAGFNGSLAMKADGTVWAWGSLAGSTAPVKVTGF